MELKWRHWTEGRREECGRWPNWLNVPVKIFFLVGGAPHAAALEKFEEIKTW